ncbi:hypothetical protein N7448_003786 [Penicillium atrosanguineum]|nr:hypothetical protein N7448_003786 [Penicillium atrosanguineum]
MKISLSALLGLAISAHASTIEYTTVTGYFLQDETVTDPSTFDYVSVNFGLINRTYPADKELKHHQSTTQWERFYNQVQKFNEDSPKNIEYKVLFLGRHGNGWHNSAETYYGTPAWNCYWAELNGNSTVTWFDAALTPAGEAQALTTTSSAPLTRTLQTANLTFNGLDLPHGSAAFAPVIKELFREGISIHTCDHRHNKSYIHSIFPHWAIESGFSEEDNLWNGVTAETSAAQDVRSTQALGEVFFGESSKKKSYVSVTSHSGEISSILRVLGHRTFSLSTGAVIPVLVKAEKKEGKATTTSVSWTASAHCTVAPITSVTACVCPSSAAPVTTPLVATGY